MTLKNNNNYSKNKGVLNNHFARSFSEYSENIFFFYFFFKYVF